MTPTRVYMRLLFWILLLCGFGIKAFAQEESGIRLPAIVVGSDTFAVVYLDEVIIYDHLSAGDKRRLRRQARREQRRQDRYDAEYARLKYNVYKVYPYANTAAYLLRDVHAKLDALPSKDARKKYLKNLEKDLNKRFKGELQEFTISQGIVLVKLINRQTGRNCFDIISEVKGSFNAVVWQGIALVFGNNLRREYEPEGRDRDVEQIVRELEANAAAAAKRG